MKSRMRHAPTGAALVFICLGILHCSSDDSAAVLNSGDSLPDIHDAVAALPRRIAPALLSST